MPSENKSMFQGNHLILSNYKEVDQQPESYLQWSMSYSGYYQVCYWTNSQIPECICAHFCSEWSIVGYETGASWDLWNWSILVHFRPCWFTVTRRLGIGCRGWNLRALDLRFSCGDLGCAMGCWYGGPGDGRRAACPSYFQSYVII